MAEAPRTIAVVGAGLMGRGIAQIAAQAGFDVAIFDVKPDAAAEARRAIAATLAMLAAKHKLTEDDAARATARIAVVGDLGELSRVDLVIEAIVERLDAKQALFAALEAIVGKRCILRPTRRPCRSPPSPPHARIRKESPAFIFSARSR